MRTIKVRNWAEIPANFTGVVEFSNGDKHWYLNGERHRVDGHAVEWSNGNKEWYLNGIQHRVDGPAIEYANGTKTWYLNGECFLSKEKWQKKIDNKNLNKDSETKTEFELTAEEIGKLVSKKNKAYGNSFEEAEKFLKLLFPNGIPTDSYSDMLCIVRIFDKLKRIATDKDAFSESPYADLIGYGILGLVKDRKKGKK